MSVAIDYFRISEDPESWVQMASRTTQDKNKFCFVVLVCCKEDKKSLMICLGHQAN